MAILNSIGVLFCYLRSPYIIPDSKMYKIYLGNLRFVNNVISYKPIYLRVIQIKLNVITNNKNKQIMNQFTYL